MIIRITRIIQLVIIIIIIIIIIVRNNNSNNKRETHRETNQLLAISRNWLVKDLLTNKQFSMEIFSGNLILLDSENRELVWSNLSLKCVVLKAFFSIINTLLIELFVWPQTIGKIVDGSRKLHDKLILELAF